MNKYILSIAILLLIVVSCKKKETPAYDPYSSYNGSVTVMRNGVAWKPKLITISDQSGYFGVAIDDNRNGFSWDQIGIGLIPLILRTYLLIDRNIWDTVTDATQKSLIPSYYNGSFNEGSDIASANYMRLDRPHFIKIDQYDPATKLVSGTFSVSFIRDSSRSKLGVYLDTVSYTDASFSATIWHVDELPK